MFCVLLKNPYKKKQKKARFISYKCKQTYSLVGRSVKVYYLFKQIVNTCYIMVVVGICRSFCGIIMYAHFIYFIGLWTIRQVARYLILSRYKQNLIFLVSLQTTFMLKLPFHWQHYCHHNTRYFIVFLLGIKALKKIFFNWFCCILKSGVIVSDYYRDQIQWAQFLYWNIIDEMFCAAYVPHRWTKNCIKFKFRAMKKTTREILNNFCRRIFIFNDIYHFMVE